MRSLGIELLTAGSLAHEHLVLLLDVRLRRRVPPRDARAVRKVVAVRESRSLLLMRWWNRFSGEEVMVRMATMALLRSTTTAGRLKVVEAGSVVVAGHVGGGHGG